MTDDELFSTQIIDDLDPADRAARMANVRDLLQSCVDQLDALGGWQAGAYVTMAISAL